MEQVSRYDSVFRQGAIMIDEAQEVFPSKRASSQAVYNAEVFLKAIQEARAGLPDCHTVRQRDNRKLPRQIDYIVQPQLRRSWEYLYVENALHRQVKHAALELKIWNWSGSATGIPLFNNMPYPPPHGSEQISRTFTGVEKTFAAYPTKQVIVSAVAKDRHTNQANLKEIADRGWQVVRDVDTDTQLVRRLAIIEDDAEEWSAPGTAPRDLGSAA